MRGERQKRPIRPTRSGGRTTGRPGMRGDLDDREVLQALEAQRCFDEGPLGVPDAIGAHLRLIESDLARLSPGKNVKSSA